MAIRETKTFWGGALQVIAAGVTAIPALAVGTITAVNGGSFQEGVDGVMDPVMNAAGQFGDEHGNKLTGTAITIAGGIVQNEIIQHHNASHHPKQS